MSKKTVDVIILSWDRVEDTKKAILSAVAQNNVEKKVYVVDQGSKAECIHEIEEIARLHDCVFVIKNNANTGVPGGRNQASFAGSGDYIVALDNDAEFLTDIELAKVVDAFESRENTAVIAFNIKRFGSNETDETSWSYGKSSSEWAERDFFTTRFVGAGHAIRRTAFQEINGYDDALFFLHEEVDLSRRLINKGYFIEYLHDIKIGHKVSKEHRVSWNSGRWLYHVRNKTYLDLKLKSSLPAFLLHVFLLQLEGLKKGMLFNTVKGTFFGIKLFGKNKEKFNDGECKFNASSEIYYRKYTPGAQGGVIERSLRRIKGVL